MTNGISLRLIPALMAVAFSGVASASGFQLLEQNASGIGNAYAGSAAIAENASTIFYNPAGMTQLKDREVSLGLTAVRPSFKFSNDASSAATLNPLVVGPASNTLSGNGGDGGGWGFIPNAYLSWALNKDVYLGLGVGAPFGLRTEFDRNWIGAAQSIHFDIKTINLNPSVAFRVNEMVSLGFGVNWQKLDAEYLRRVGTANYAAAGFPGASSLARLKLEDDTWGWNAGALFTLSPATKVGLSYRSTMKYDTTGDIKVTGPSATVNARGTSDAKAEVKLPDTFILSGTHQLNDRWQLLGDVSWTGWSSIPKIDIIRTSGTFSGSTAQTLHTEFRDTWRVAFGATYLLNPAWKIKMGIAYDQTPVKGASTRLVSLPDNDRTWFSLGGQWKPNKDATLDFGVAYLYVKDAKVQNNQVATPAALNPAAIAAALAANQGLVDGTFKDNCWILGAQYSMSF